MTLAGNSFTRNLHMLTITVLLLVSLCRLSLVSINTYFCLGRFMLCVSTKYYNNAYHSNFSLEPVLCLKL